MVFANKHSEILIEKFPNFKNSSSLAEAMELYNEDADAINIHVIFTALTNYVVDELVQKNSNITNEEIEIYRFVEEVRAKYSNSPDNTDEGDFDNAACTCFLESLLNRASADRIKYERFIPYIGEKSKEYCRAWDEFTGVYSPGLWGDDKSK